MPFLQGNLALVVGLALFALVLAIRVLSKDQQLRDDVRGATVFFGVWVALRVLGFALTEVDLPTVARGARVAWMLAFAFGSVRTGVAFGLWLYRKFNVGPTTKILRDLVDFILYVVAAVPILKTQLQIDLTSLLATSAILSVVLGLALQETLGNLFAGLALQLERPFRAGDHISVGEFTGRVVQVAWRATRIETIRREEITLPNSLIAKQPLRNFTNGGAPVGVDLFVSVAYSVPPNVVRAEVLAALDEIPLILKDPAPACRLASFEDSGVRYLVRYFFTDYAALTIAADEIHTRLWYRFSRTGIEIPYPQRVIHTRPVETRGPTSHLELLAGLDLLAPFSDQERSQLAAAAVQRRFGKGETIITEGTEGHSFYVIASGEVVVARGGIEVARLNRGAYLGEMSLLTGEPRSATVLAATDVVLLELDREEFARHFSAVPERARQMAEMLTARQAQLASVTVAGAGPQVPPEPGHIFTRLKSIFRITG